MNSMVRNIPHLVNLLWLWVSSAKGDQNIFMASWWLSNGSSGVYLMLVHSFFCLRIKWRVFLRSKSWLLVIYWVIGMRTPPMGPQSSLSIPTYPSRYPIPTFNIPFHHIDTHIFKAHYTHTHNPTFIIFPMPISIARHIPTTLFFSLSSPFLH